MCWREVTIAFTQGLYFMGLLISTESTEMGAFPLEWRHFNTFCLQEGLLNITFNLLSHMLEALPLLWEKLSSSSGLSF